VIKEMMAAIIENRTPSTNASEARKSVDIVLAMHESARTGQPVNMINEA